MRRPIGIAFTLSLLASTALAQEQEPTPLVPDAPPANEWEKFQTDEVAPLSTGIEIGETSAASLNSLQLNVSVSPQDKWLAKAFSKDYYSGAVRLNDVVPAGSGMLEMDAAALATPLYHLLANATEAPDYLSSGDVWFNFRIEALVRLGFVRSAYDLLESVPRAQVTDAMLEQKALLAAVMNDWTSACAAINALPEEKTQWPRLFCMAKTGKQSQLNLQLSVMEEEGEPAPSWFVQLAEHLQYPEKSITDLPPQRDALTWMMLLDAAPDALPKDTLNAAFFAKASAEQLLQLWYTHRLVDTEPYLNRFVKSQPEDYELPQNAREEYAQLVAQHLDKSEAASALRDAEGETWGELAPLMDKLANPRLSKNIIAPDDALEAAAKDGGDAWVAVMRAYVLMEALDYNVRPEYWQTLGAYAEGRAYEAERRYATPRMVDSLQAMREKSYRTDVLLSAMGLLRDAGAMAEQPDTVLAALVRSLKASGQEGTARDVAAEALLGLLPRVQAAEVTVEE